MKAFKQIATKMGDYKNAQEETEALYGPFRDILLDDLQKVELNKRHLLDKHVVLADTSNIHNDSFKILRSQVMKAVKEKGVKIVGVTSTHAGQGKTTISCNLSMCIARLKNQYSILADYDLRRPNVANTLGLGDVEGVSDYIASDKALHELVVQPSGIGNFFILPGGTPTTESSEVINSNRFEALNSTLKQTAKNCIIVIDLPPVLVSDDVMELMDFVDALIIVVEEGKTEKKDLMLLNELLNEDKVLGYVMNKATESMSAYGYGYRY